MSLALKHIGRYERLKKSALISVFNKILCNKPHATQQYNGYFLANSLLCRSFAVKRDGGLSKYTWLKISRNFASYPDHMKITLPALSPTMEKGNIQSWNKKEGDAVKEGDALAEIETDKAVVPLETIEDGYLAKIILSAGAKDIPVGQLMCIMVKNQADVAAFKDFQDESPPKADTTAPAMAPTPASAPTPSVVPTPTVAQTPITAKQASAPDDRAYASPMAKALAKAQNMRLEGKGSGVFDSIKSTDVSSKKSGGSEAKLGTTTPPGPNNFKDIPVSNIRGVIAKRLLESKTTIPHFYVTIECQMDNILRLREKVNKQFKKDGIRVSINDFVIKATAMACIKVPEANSYWMDKTIRQFEHCDVSVAVSTHTGLITPIIFSADLKGVMEISHDMQDLAKKARNNKLKPADYQGGTVCISNMGMFGIDCFSAIINPPQALILAVGATTKKLVSDKSPNGFREINVMLVTASADHRLVDGAVCARWLQLFRDFIEEPGSMIL